MAGVFSRKDGCGKDKGSLSRVNVSGGVRQRSLENTILNGVGKRLSCWAFTVDSISRSKKSSG